MGITSFFIKELFPFACLNCGNSLLNEEGFCPACWDLLQMITAPQCVVCGVPFPFQGHALTCGLCLKNPPPYDKARAVYAYADPIRHVLLKFKHGDDTTFGEIFGKLLARLPLGRPDVVVPVPLHWTRLLRRQYNQSGLMARVVARIYQVPFWLALKRQRKTPSQGGLSRQQRLRNIHKAFVLKKTYYQQVHQKHVLLIDDVYTTGATVSECAKVLKTFGASNVSIATVARSL